MVSRFERRYDLLLKDMIFTIKEDYAGYGEAWPDYQPAFYITACGTKHHKNEMYDDLFLQYASQMLAATGDRSLRLKLLPGGDYAPWTPGFFVRRCGGELVVTHTYEENRLHPGDVIESINAAAPGQMRENLQKNFFYAREPEREIWHGLLKMADHVLVRHADGSREDMPLRRYPSREEKAEPEIRDLGRGRVYLRPHRFDGSGAVGRLIAENRALLAGCEKLILDLRRCNGGEEADFLPLLPYVVKGRRDYAEILAEQPLLTNYTANNCACLWYPVQCWIDEHGRREDLAACVDDIKAKSGAGWLEEPSDKWSDVRGTIDGRAPDRVVLLTDTWCENAGEAFAEIALGQENVISVGRPTMGTLDYQNPVSKALDDDFIFTWPMSKRKSVSEGSGLKGKGLAPGVYMPFTPEEAEKDILLERALALS